VFRRRRFFGGDAKHGGASELGDIEWLKPDGTEMEAEDWNSGFARSLMVFLNGDAIPEPDHAGRKITDDHFLLLFNAHSDKIEFHLPGRSFGSNWLVRLDTRAGTVDQPGAPWRARSRHAVAAHSLVILSTSAVPEPDRRQAVERAQRVAPTFAQRSQ
jgi:glycogen operon protein